MRVWEGLDEFVTVAETGNFTRAAARLGVSVSQVSRAIGRIEERLGVELFSRNTRRVTLTESGKLFEERCRQLINKREAAFEEVASHKRHHERAHPINVLGGLRRANVNADFGRFSGEIPRDKCRLGSH